MENVLAAGSAPIPATSKAVRKKRVLIIEDDTLTRITLAKLFSKFNYDIIEACNGYVGIKLFKTHQPDLIVTDLLMPDKEGLSTISEIRAANKSVPIVAMTSGGTTHNMKFLSVACELGANHTLSKPLKPDEVCRLLQALESDAEAGLGK